MGHFYNTLRGEGRNKQEAISDAISAFIRENGTRHDVRDTSKEHLVERVPPMGVEGMEGKTKVFYGYKRNTAAPQSQWLEVWEFELHTHA